MAKIKGEEIVPVKATKAQAEMIQELLDLDIKLKQAYERKDAVIRQLFEMQGEAPVAAEVVVLDGDNELITKWMTFGIGRPTGHYVYYRELDFIHKAATTKKDKEELDLD